MTILELLVVIGIMAVLFALIVTTITGVRNSSKAVSCASNEHQIYTALVAFAAEHDGYLPIPAGVGATPANNGANCAWAMDANYAASGGTLDFTVGTLWPYMALTTIGRQQAVWCPADSAEISQHSGILNLARNFSYSFNVNIAASNAGPQISSKLSACVKAPAKILIYEENAPNDECCFGGSGVDDLPSGRHGTAQSDKQGTSNDTWMNQGRGNFCFFDGHIESLSPQQIMTDVQQHPTNSRWYPLNQ
jgi:prepilin-type processing-associated H-X9-DG protein